MAHLWVDDCESGGWVIAMLPVDAYTLDQNGPRPAEGSGHDLATSRVLLVRSGNGTAERWLLLARKLASVLVNGQPLFLGTRLLRDRDEIVVRELESGSMRRFFFSNERLARTEPFPATSGTIPCPRCKQQIRQGDLAVQCPGCGVWHHEKEALPCWSYDATCAALCGQPTNCGEGFRWTPEDL